MKKLRTAAKDILFAFGLNIVWAALMILMFKWFDRLDAESSIPVIFFACVFAPLWEEAVFRHFPLSIIKSLKQKRQDQLTLPTILFTSAIFGLAHGSVDNILMQGFGGIVLSYVYLKHGYWGSVISHSLWNLAMLFLVHL